MSDQRYVVFDYETRSEADLREVGSYEYANHPTTKIMCVAWRSGTRDELLNEVKAKKPAKVWSPVFGGPDSEIDLIRKLLNPSFQIVAHNAFFEQVITRFVFSKWDSGLKNIPTDRFICTASMAAALALPRNLEGACMALGLPVQKDMEGRRLMLKYTKPRKHTKFNENDWHLGKDELKRIMEYCQKDIDAETWLFLTVPELTPAERQVWLLDQKINFRGFRCDRDSVQKIMRLITEEEKILTEDLKTVTHGVVESVSQRDRTMQYLLSIGCNLPNLQAKTVEDALKDKNVYGAARRVLEIRQAMSKTSNAKYWACEARSRTDGRLRDNLVYHTASTGRWGGSGFQPHNLPKPKHSFSEIETAIEAIGG